MTFLLIFISIICIGTGLYELLWPQKGLCIKNLSEEEVNKYSKSALIRAHSVASIIGGVLLIPLAFEKGKPEIWVVLEIVNLVALWLYVRFRCMKL